MATATVNLSNWRYSINGGSWQQGSGNSISVGKTGSGDVYRGWVTFSLSGYNSTHVMQNCSFSFKRADSYGRIYWTIGITDSKPAANFSASDITVLQNNYETTSLAEYTISLSASVMESYKGKTMYICFLGYGSGYSYGEIDAVTSGKVPTLTVNYQYGKSTLSASNGNINAVNTVTVTQKDASQGYKHTLTAVCAGQTVTVFSNVVDANASFERTWTPSLNTFANAIPNAMSASCTYTLSTYKGSTLIGQDTKTVTLSFKSADVKPTVALTVEDAKGTPTSYAERYGGFIIGMSKFRVTATGTFVGSNTTQASVIIHSNGGTQYESPTTTGAVNAGASYIDAKITDSRAQSATADTTVTLLPYNAPALSGVSTYRSTSSGTSDPSGAYLRVNYTWAVTDFNMPSPYQSNAKRVRYRSRAKGGDYGSWTSITPQDYSGTSFFVISADTENSYDIQVALNDDFSTVTVTTSGSTASVVFDMRIGGKGFAIGKVAEKDGFDVGWQAFFDNWVTLYGTGIGKDSSDIIRWRLSPDGNIRSYDSSGVERAGIYPAEGQLALYDSSGNRNVQIRGDGTASATPLPVNQGGTASTGTESVTATITAGATGSVSVIDARRWGRVAMVTLDCVNASAVSAMNYLARATLTTDILPKRIVTAVQFTGAHLSVCSLDTNGTVTARVMVGTLPANSNRRFVFTYLIW